MLLEIMLSCLGLVFMSIGSLSEWGCGVGVSLTLHLSGLSVSAWNYQSGPFESRHVMFSIIIRSHNVQQFFPYLTRGLSGSRSGLLVLWPTKITPTVQKTGLIKPPPFSLSVCKSVALAGLGLGLVTWNKSTIRCEGMCLMTRI